MRIEAHRGRPEFEDSDCFHNGFAVLQEVKKHYEFFRYPLSETDITTLAVLNLVDKYMLQEDPNKRWEAGRLLQATYDELQRTGKSLPEDREGVPTSLSGQTTLSTSPGPFTPHPQDIRAVSHPDRLPSETLHRRAVFQDANGENAINRGLSSHAKETNANHEPSSQSASETNGTSHLNGNPGSGSQKLRRRDPGAGLYQSDIRSIRQKKSASVGGHYGSPFRALDNNVPNGQRRQMSIRHSDSVIHQHRFYDQRVRNGLADATESMSKLSVRPTQFSQGSNADRGEEIMSSSPSLRRKLRNPDTQDVNFRKETTNHNDSRICENLRSSVGADFKYVVPRWEVHEAQTWRHGDRRHEIPDKDHIGELKERDFVSDVVLLPSF